MSKTEDVVRVVSAKKRDSDRHLLLQASKADALAINPTLRWATDPRIAARHNGQSGLLVLLEQSMISGQADLRMSRPRAGNQKSLGECNPMSADDG